MHHPVVQYSTTMLSERVSQRSRFHLPSYGSVVFKQLGKPLVSIFYARDHIKRCMCMYVCMHACIYEC